MFAVRRIFRNTTQLSNYICTSGIVRCDEANKKEPKVLKTEAEENKTAANKDETTKTVKSDILSGLRPPKKSGLRKSKINTDLVSSAENVASELGGDKESTKKDLLNYINALEVTSEREGSFPEMKFKDLHPQDKQFMSAKRGKEGFPRQRREASLNFFNKSFRDTEEKVKLKLWDSLLEEELAAMAKIPPRNYFDELIQWTNEGKLWKFPIDNEQGLDEEAAVDFTEHIFLEKHLKPWCPEKGPIRKFMQMVLIGLSKNPYLSVEEKKEHINWFRDYFERKRKLLQELGAMGPPRLEDQSEQEQKKS